MSRFRKFWYLTGREKLLFFEACILLLLSNLSVNTMAFRNIDSYLQAHRNNRYLQAHRNNRTRDAIVRSDHTKNDIKLVDLSLSRAANALPWNSTCLSRSIAQLIMLRRRGIPAVLFAGVKSLEDSSLSAHAWVRTGDDVMDMSSDPAENAEFTVLLRIGQEPFADSSRNSV
jgi:Transglutaminase-like superfamily